jgi:hypothetical protein
VEHFSFAVAYERNRAGYHGSKRPDALSTIWDLSFKSLLAPGAAILGILAYISPDSVPEHLFTSAKSESLPESVQSADEDFYDIVEPLQILALVKRDVETKSFSWHRLVQTQYRYHLEQKGRQEAFDQAVKLLFDGFGRVES